MATTPLSLPTGFEISPYFSFVWFDLNANTVYNTDPIDDMTNNIRYYQPVQIGGGGYQADTGLIQLVSKWVPTASLHRWDNTLVKSIDLTPIDPPILNADFICYNGVVDFGEDVEPGYHYIRITYTDDSEVLHQWQTTPLDAEIFHDGTQLIEASNFKNEKGAVFVNSDGTFLTIPYRVKSFLYLPIPDTDTNDFEDQYNELTQEDSIPSITVTQYIGGPELLSFAVIEHINLLYSLNQNSIDGKPFAKLSGSAFKPTDRAILPGGAFWTVDLQPNAVYPNEIYVTGDANNSEFIVVKKYVPFLAQSANFACVGIFNSRKNLIRIAFVNNGEDVLTIQVGTSEGDASYGTINLNADETDSIDIGKLHKIVTTVWISGITGANLDVFFDYNDYSATAVTPPTGTSGWKENTLYWFDEVTANSFGVEFDVSTGLGRVGTEHEGCILADGRNGVPNRIGQMIQAWNSLEVSPAATRGTTVGVLGNEIIILADQMPEHSHLIANGDTSNNPLDTGGNNILTEAKNQGNARDYALSGSGTQPVRGKTSTVPATDTQAPFNVTNFSAILPAFYYVIPV